MENIIMITIKYMKQILALDNPLSVCVALKK